ncbi:hypothetical protein HPB52_015443 [Rhipicephalus sanguineus]|uniref:Transmembrane protein n=1 Tax=Rhipicephalus sanguineus TaxID=34632 RepID=A0A9D4PH59_RHISA|nr:hypothetical protein HPB52_015443 [Rhipicephalus sanguineus]
MLLKQPLQKQMLSLTKAFSKHLPLIVLVVLLSVLDFGALACVSDLQQHMLGYCVILSGCVVVEACISWVSMRGSILDAAPRASMQHLLYVRLGILVIEVCWLVVGVIWVSKHYDSCPMGVAKDAILGIIVCNWCVLLSVLVTVWCTFDRAGRTWVKMKRYQRSLQDGKLRYKRSGNSQRNWRHRYGTHGTALHTRTRMRGCRCQA